MYLETINEKTFRSFLSNPDISVLDGNVLDKHHNSNFYRFVALSSKTKHPAPSGVIRATVAC